MRQFTKGVPPGYSAVFHCKFGGERYTTQESCFGREEVHAAFSSLFGTALDLAVFTSLASFGLADTRAVAAPVTPAVAALLTTAGAKIHYFTAFPAEWHASPAREHQQAQ
mmetsp:Transcript_32339/g.86683  ORF Transcript_32339/g.86683 Transcript_32339/m.86683 type:complete len:110 (+) Transcript_32339:108-437(+)